MWGRRGDTGGAVPHQDPHSPGCLRHLSLHARPEAQVSSSGQGTRGQVTEVPTPQPTPNRSHGTPAVSPPSPQPHVPPCHAALSAQVCPLGPARPSRPAPLGPPRLGRKAGSGSGWVFWGKRGEKGLSTAPSAPPSSALPDGWTDRGVMPPAMPLPWGRSCQRGRGCPGGRRRTARGVMGSGLGVGVGPPPQPQPQPRGLTRTHPLALLAFGAGRARDAQTRGTLNTKGSSLGQWDRHRVTAKGVLGGAGGASGGCVPPCSAPAVLTRAPLSPTSPLGPGGPSGPGKPLSPCSTPSGTISPPIPPLSPPHSWGAAQASPRCRHPARLWPGDTDKGQGQGQEQGYLLSSGTSHAGRL